MLQDFAAVIVGYQIIIFVVPYQVPRTDMIPLTVMAQFLFFLYVPLEILKTDLRIGIDGRVDFIDIIINTFIHRLNTAAYQNLPLKLFRLVCTCQLLQLFYERV